MPYDVLDQSLAAAAPASTAGSPRASYGYTLSVMEIELEARLGGRTDITAGAGSRYRLWINEAYVDFCTTIDLPEMFGSVAITLVPGQHLYLLPEPVFGTTGVALIDADSYIYGGRPLDKIDLTAYRKAAVQDDTPVAYFRHGGMLVFWPKPNAAKTVAVDFRIRPDDLVAATDSPFVGKEWHEGILLSARQKAYSALQEFDKAALAENDYIRFIERKLDKIAKEDVGRKVGSSVPRSKRELIRGRYRPVGEPGF